MRKTIMAPTMKTALRALCIIAIAAVMGSTPVAAEEKLTAPEITDVLVNYTGWDSDSVVKSMETCRWMWSELVLARAGSDTVKALEAVRYYPQRDSYQTLKVTGPILKYITTINVCDAAADRQEGGCDAVTKNEIEVVSRSLVIVNRKVLRGGSGAGVATGQIFTCVFRKK